MAEIPNDGVVILGIAVAERGIVVDASFPGDQRLHLDRVHQFIVGYEQEEFGAQAREIVELAENLAFELKHGYAMQPRTGSED